MFEPMTPDDLDRLGPLQPEGWSDIVDYFRFYVDAAFCRPVKVERDGALAAVGTVILNGSTGWLAHIIVAPDHRRRGLGEAVTRRLIETAEESGRPVQLLIATDQGRPLYERLGFTTSQEYTFHGPRRLEPAPEREDVAPLGTGDMPDVRDLDRRATGEDRLAMLSPHLSQGWKVMGPDGSLRGFLLPTLAESPVVAADPEAGRALLRLRAGLSEEKIVLPSRNAPGMDWAAEHGFAVTLTAARMVRGGGDPLRPDMVFNRVGGHFG